MGVLVFHIVPSSVIGAQDSKTLLPFDRPSVVEIASIHFATDKRRKHAGQEWLRSTRIHHETWNRGGCRSWIIRPAQLKIIGSCGSSPVDLTPEQVQAIIAAGNPVFATYVPPGTMMAPSDLSPQAPANPPNILIILVDQLRFFESVVAGDSALADAYLPSLTALRNNSYVFNNYYTAANMCTPARATLVTGMYSQQTYQLLTEATDAIPYLNSTFPTYGSALNDAAVTTAYAGKVYWFGKWHLAGETVNNDLNPYGFLTRTYPSGSYPAPNGWYNEGVSGGLWPPAGCGVPPGCGPGQVTGKFYASDNDIKNDFISWISGKPSSPWCATVSLINPHDIGGYPKWILDWPNTAGCPTSGSSPNFAPIGTPASIYASGITPPNLEDDSTCVKPTLYHIYQYLRDQAEGTVTDWGKFLNYYFALQAQIDNLIGNITSPASNTILGAVNQYDSLENTVVVFTSDHGEYGGAHDLHGKGGAVYEEGIHVPLYVSYPHGRTGTSTVRNQLCSSVDFFPLIVEIATGVTKWRALPQYQHLLNRQSLAFYLTNGNSPETRVAKFDSSGADLPYILHQTDEIWAQEYEPGSTQFGELTTAKIGCVSAGTPIQNHVVAVRTNQATVSSANPSPSSNAKLAVYNLWNCNGYPKSTVHPQFEFNDYKNKGNTEELANDAPSGPNTPATFCPTTSSDPTAKSFCNHLATLGNVTVSGTQSGLIASELNPTLSDSALVSAQASAKTAYLDYLNTGDPTDCVAPYHTECGS